MAVLRRQVARPERVLLVAPPLLGGVAAVAGATLGLCFAVGVPQPWPPVAALGMAGLAWSGAFAWSTREPHVSTVLEEGVRRIGFGGSGKPRVRTRNSWDLPGEYYER